MLNEKNTLIICIDIQEKLVNMLGEKKDKITKELIERREANGTATKE